MQPYIKERIARVTTGRWIEYLSSIHWAKDSDFKEGVEIWYTPQKEYQGLVLITRDFADYHSVMWRLLKNIAEFQNQTPLWVLLELLGENTSVYSLRSREIPNNLTVVKVYTNQIENYTEIMVINPRVEVDYLRLSFKAIKDTYYQKYSSSDPHFARVVVQKHKEVLKGTGVTLELVWQETQINPITDLVEIALLRSNTLLVF